MPGDRDGIYRAGLVHWVSGLGREQKLSTDLQPPSSNNQRAHVMEFSLLTANGLHPQNAI
jgi:hypothetical protein